MVGEKLLPVIISLQGERAQEYIWGFLLCLEASAETAPACVRVHAKEKHDDYFPGGILGVRSWFDFCLRSNEYNFTNYSVSQNMDSS